MRLTALAGLDRTKYEVRICCLERKGPLGEQAERLGFPVDVLHRRDSLYNLCTTYSLFRYLKARRFLIVQSSLFRANFHARIAAKLAGVPVIIAEEHGEHYQFNRAKLLPYMLTDNILSLLTDKIICCAQEMRKSLTQIEHISPDKIEVIFNAINEKELIPQKTKDQMKKELGIDKDSVVIGTVGTLSLAKAQDMLLRAFAEIARDFVDQAVLLVVGDGPRKSELQEYARELGIARKVLFTGSRLDIADLLNAMDMFVLSSKKEGLPITLLEAMYMGVPCIVPRIGGIPEVIADGKNGYLFAFADAADLSRKMQTVLKSREAAQAVAEAAREKVRIDFLSQRYARQLEKLHHQLLSKKKLD